MACPALQYFSTLSNKRHDPPLPPPKKKIYSTQNVCFDFLYDFCRNISHSKKNLGIYKNCILVSSCKLPVILLRLNETWIFLTDLQKMLKHQVSWISSSWNQVVACGQKDGRAYGRTDMTEPTIAFRNFAKGHKNKLEQPVHNINKNWETKIPRTLCFVYICYCKIRWHNSRIF